MYCTILNHIVLATGKFARTSIDHYCLSMQNTVFFALADKIQAESAVSDSIAGRRSRDLGCAGPRM
jgi:hypothetical protein